ncbi:MAG: phospholipase D-like domain-containing protein, partial [Planctomycetota bacterium]|nr:phospholipase D-like domain-containing protein [Planctomycetota bacterium]
MNDTRKNTIGDQISRSDSSQLAEAKIRVPGWAELRDKELSWSSRMSEMEAGTRPAWSQAPCVPVTKDKGCPDGRSKGKGNQQPDEPRTDPVSASGAVPAQGTEEDSSDSSDMPGLAKAGEAMAWGAPFVGYDEAAEDAVDFLCARNGSQVAAILGAKQTHKCGRWLIQNANKGDKIRMICYTIDLEDLCNDLGAAGRRRADARVTVDHRSALSGPTRDTPVRLRALKSAGVEVYFATGKNIQEEYSAIGRNVFPGRGLCHAKVLMVGDWMLIGSTNWTTSSACNYELNLLVRLSREAHGEFVLICEKLKLVSVLLTDELLADSDRRRQERKLSKSSSRSRSLS